MDSLMYEGCVPFEKRLMPATNNAFVSLLMTSIVPCAVAYNYWLSLNIVCLISKLWGRFWKNQICILYIMIRLLSQPLNFQWTRILHVNYEQWKLSGKITQWKRSKKFMAKKKPRNLITLTSLVRFRSSKPEISFIFSIEI